MKKITSALHRHTASSASDSGFEDGNHPSKEQGDTLGAVEAANVTDPNSPATQKDHHKQMEEGEEDTSQRQVTGSGDFPYIHGDGHQVSSDVDRPAASKDEHMVKPVTHERVKHEEVEELSRARQHDRHIHHVEHHVQPIKDKDVRDEVHHSRVIPETEIHERHANTHEDSAAFKAVGDQFKDKVIDEAKTRKVVDLGETLTVNEHHHIHQVIQPVIEKETHDRHRIHTTIPIHHVTHEAPVLGKTTYHEPLKMEDFVGAGGMAHTQDTHHNISGKVLHEHPCERQVHPADGFNILEDNGVEV